MIGGKGRFPQICFIVYEHSMLYELNKYILFDAHK